MNWKMFALVCTMAAAVALAANAQSVGFPISNASGVPQKPTVIHLPPGVYRLEKQIVLKHDIWDLEKAMEAKIKDNGGGCVRSLKE